MREALAKALSGPINLDEQESRERPVDRLHAMACASRDSHLSSLGVSFIALRAANRPDEYARTVSKLEKCLAWGKRRIAQEMRYKLARQAVMESIVNACPRCSGTKEVRAEDGLDGAQRMKPCPPSPEGCGGHGLRRYSDDERMASLDVDKHVYRTLERHLADAIGFLNAGEAEAVRLARRLLEKY